MHTKPRHVDSPCPSIVKSNEVQRSSAKIPRLHATQALCGFLDLRPRRRRGLVFAYHRLAFAHCLLVAACWEECLCSLDVVSPCAGWRVCFCVSFTICVYAERLSSPLLHVASASSALSHLLTHSYAYWLNTYPRQALSSLLTRRHGRQ
jgi:hypothetical protein